MCEKLLQHSVAYCMGKSGQIKLSEETFSAFHQSINIYGFNSKYLDDIDGKWSVRFSFFFYIFDLYSGSSQVECVDPLRVAQTETEPDT